MNTNQTDISGESRRELAAGVLKQAKSDLRRFRRSTTTIGRELYRDAYDWIMADEFSWPFSFLNVCDTLKISAAKVREELMGDLSLGPLVYWTRRCVRAMRDVPLRIRQLSQSDDTGSATIPTPTLAHDTVF